MDRTKKISRAIVLTAVTLFTLVGCGGGDGIDGTGLVEVSGTAAVGAPIVNATVTIKASSGAKKSSQTGQDGKFKTEVTGLSGPFLMKVVQANGSALFSIAAGGGTANIHPFTDLIVRNWFKVQGLDLESEFNSDTAAAQLPSVAQINEIEAAIKKVIALTLAQYSLPADLNLISSAFDANGQGFDNFLDHADVVIINNSITIIVSDPKTSIDGEIVKDVALNTNLAQADLTPPSVPTGLRVVPASGTEIIVVWNPTTDNLAVAGYNVYRQDQSSATTTPFPVLSESGLSPSTEYCYQVEAFDSERNMSGKSTEVCAMTLATTDTTPPSAASNLQATTVSSSAILLSWTAPLDDSVVGYDIYRGSNGAVNTKVASITSASFLNINLASTAEYCYQVFAFDAARKVSAASNQACARTATPLPQPPSSGARSLEFSSVVYGTSEAYATVLITVNRNGDAGEAVSVGYQIGDGTATAPADFVAASGTLSWSANDTAAKTFLVQIKGDAVTEDAETVLLSLLNPSANAALGNSANATLTIGNSGCNGRLSSDVTVDTTITDTCTLVTRYVYISGGATLTVAPGVALVFQSGTGLNASSDGALTAIGTPTKPILFTGEQQTPGYWTGIQFTFSNNVKNELNYATIEFGGAAVNGTANVVMFGPVGLSQRLKIKNAVLSDSAGYGFEFDDGSMVDAFSNNVVTRNAKGPGYLPANLVGKLDLASSYTGNVKDQMLIVDGSDVTNDQTWPAINVPYSTGGHSIDANLIIQAGATLIFSSGGQFNVSDTGSLAAIGTPTRMITFTGAQPTRGYWLGIQYTFSNNINNALDYVIVEYGGGVGGNGNANVVMFGTIGLTQRLKLSNSMLRQSLGYGFEFSYGSEVDVFANNTITGNQLGAGLLPADRVKILDAASAYTGNDKDILVVENGSVTTTQTWQAINVPYSVGTVYVDDNAHLTIAAGTTLVFSGGGAINVSQFGALTANGTVTSPILFTAEQMLPGFWGGIQFSFSNNINNVLNYVTVEYAGGTSVALNNGPGAVILFGSNTSATITNSTFRSSESYGIWLDVGSQINEDVNTSNVFSGNATGDILQN